MKSFNKTTILLLFATLSTLLVGGLYAYFFIIIKNKTEVTAELISKADELSGKGVRTASAALALRSEKEKIDKLSSYIIKESEITLFVKKIESLGVQSGATVTLESLDPGLTDKTIPFLGFRVKAIGKFEEVERVLVLLENFPAKFEWKTVRLARDSSPVQQVETSSKKSITPDPQWSLEVFLTARNFISASEEARGRATSRVVLE